MSAVWRKADWDENDQVKILLSRILSLTNDVIPADWLNTRLHLFSHAHVHLSPLQESVIQKTVHAIETVSNLPLVQKKLLSDVPLWMQKNPGNPGVFFCYDFHLNEDEIKLIEINTNAGGAFMMALLEAAYNPSVFETYKKQFMQMFLTEWKNKNSNRPLCTIAIVDESPEQQFFYPEFLLFKALFQQNQLHAVIVDPSQFEKKQNQLWVGDLPIDMIYNRLTDFDLSFPAHQMLKQAYQNQTLMLTPHPYAHALYANKRNFVDWSDAQWLIQAGADQQTIEQLKTVIPKTQMVYPEDENALWSLRKNLFFKPISGYGGKGVYRGDKITRGVFSDILSKKYIAQEQVSPGQITHQGERYKFDVRAYVYQRKILGITARLYQGQTTNFRTKGGGFSLVKIIPEAIL